MIVDKFKKWVSNLKADLTYKWICRWWNWKNEENWPLAYINKFCKKGYFHKPTRKIYIGSLYELPCTYSLCRQRWWVQINVSNIWWKDKFNTPRFECNPYFTITFFKKWCISIYWTYPEFLKEKYPNEKFNEDGFWEQALWTYFYSNGDLEKAIKTWPWKNMDTKKSTWNMHYLKSKIYILEQTEDEPCEYSVIV